MITIVFDTSTNMWTGWDIAKGAQFGGYYATFDEAKDGLAVCLWRGAQGWPE